jgi:uncharacterized protein (TIGR02117 family)
MVGWLVWALVLLALGVGGCAGPVVSRPPAPEDAAGPRRDVWVVRHRWHTSLVVRSADVDARVWPESQDLGEAAYLEVGWGDRDFYPAPVPSLWDAIDPVIRATPAALHVGALDAGPAELFGAERVVRLTVTSDGLDRLVRFFHAHYARDGQGRPVRIGAGYYPRSAFYLAEGRYHALTYNSNHWTASALREAGLPADPTTTGTAGAMMRQAAQIAGRQPGR